MKKVEAERKLNDTHAFAQVECWDNDCCHLHFCDPCWGNHWCCAQTEEEAKMIKPEEKKAGVGATEQVKTEDKDRVAAVCMGYMHGN